MSKTIYHHRTKTYQYRTFCMFARLIIIGHRPHLTRWNISLLPVIGLNYLTTATFTRKKKPCMIIKKELKNLPDKK